jgi:hypothetical protein
MQQAHSRIIDRMQYRIDARSHDEGATKSNSKVCCEPMTNSDTLNTETAPPLGRTKAIILAAMVSTGLIGSGAIDTGRAEAGPVIAPNGVTIVDDRRAFFYRGRHYCWYHAAWRGPGWYWCGYAWHRGFGWGGVYGWHHWHGGRPGYPHGGYHPGGGKPGGGKPPAGNPPGGGKPPAGNPSGGPRGGQPGGGKASIQHFIN